MIYEQTDGAQQKAEDQDRKLMTDRFHEQAPVEEWIKKIYEKRGKKIHGKVGQHHRAGWYRHGILCLSRGRDQNGSASSSVVFLIPQNQFIKNL